jgi:hypothetical protein
MQLCECFLSISRIYSIYIYNKENVKLLSNDNIRKNFMNFLKCMKYKSKKYLFIIKIYMFYYLVCVTVKNFVTCKYEY